MQIGILLTTSPEHQNTYTVCQLAEAFTQGSHTVEIFLMDDGVFNAKRNSSRRRLYSNFEALLKRKIPISLCAMSAESRGLLLEDLLPGIGYSSQNELSELVAKSDRFLYFG